MPGNARITLRLPREVVDRLDRVASERGCSRARVLERLLEGQGPPMAAATPERALQLLAESAEAGSVPARIAFARQMSKVRPSDAIARRRDELAQARMRREHGR